MTGFFDSGMGGINTALEFKRLMPRESLLLLTDYGRAPFGDRTDSEIVELAEDNIFRLAAAGAERVLIACCTVSSLYGRLSREARRIAIPIVTPTARAAEEASQGRRIAVMATEATVRSHAFRRAAVTCHVCEIATPELVRLAEGCDPECGAADGIIASAVEKVAKTGADTVVLGCTHFHSLEGEIAREAKKHGITKIISSAREGARELYRILKQNGRA